MPKGGKKGNRKSCDSVTTDVKLSDFADCSTKKGRLRKSDGNSILAKEVADLQNDEDISWFDRDLDEFNINTESETPKKQLRSKTLESLSERPGIQYPIDVWYLIGGFIKPEDVKLFASICKDSHFVSRSYSFWIKMYKRYYKSDNHLPQRLQPECIEQPFCLKICVIRALYYLYPIFNNQLSSHPINSDVYSLSNLCCTSMWRVHQEGKWVFHFKFQKTASLKVVPLTYSIAIKNLWNGRGAVAENQEKYVNLNPDEGCKILRFFCSHYVSVPMVMGSRLSDVRINLAADLRRHKLQLTFAKSSYTTKQNGYCDIAQFDAVENMMVLDWWHPQYPFDTNV